MTKPLTAEDRFAITDLIHGYTWALDTGDEHAFAACFAPDGVLVWDAFDQPDRWRGTAQLTAFARFLGDLPTTAGRQHHVSNIIIDGAGDAATARSYVVVIVRDDPGPHPTTVMGWYEDRFVRTAAGWRIAERTIRDWSGPILARLAGQTGERVPRPRPPFFAALTALGEP